MGEALSTESSKTAANVNSTNQSTISAGDSAAAQKNAVANNDTILIDSISVVTPTQVFAGVPLAVDSSLILNKILATVTVIGLASAAAAFYVNSNIELSQSALPNSIIAALVVLGAAAATAGSSLKIFARIVKDWTQGFWSLYFIDAAVVIFTLAATFYGLGEFSANQDAYGTLVYKLQALELLFTPLLVVSSLLYALYWIKSSKRDQTAQLLNRCYALPKLALRKPSEVFAELSVDGCTAINAASEVVGGVAEVSYRGLPGDHGKRIVSVNSEVYLGEEVVRGHVKVRPLERERLLPITGIAEHVRSLCSQNSGAILGVRSADLTESVSAYLFAVAFFSGIFAIYLAKQSQNPQVVLASLATLLLVVRVHSFIKAALWRLEVGIARLFSLGAVPRSSNSIEALLGTNACALYIKQSDVRNEYQLTSFEILDDRLNRDNLLALSYSIASAANQKVYHSILHFCQRELEKSNYNLIALDGNPQVLNGGIIARSQGADLALGTELFLVSRGVRLQPSEVIHKSEAAIGEVVFFLAAYDEPLAKFTLKANMQLPFSGETVEALMNSGYPFTAYIQPNIQTNVQVLELPNASEKKQVTFVDQVREKLNLTLDQVRVVSNEKELPEHVTARLKETGNRELLVCAGITPVSNATSDDKVSAMPAATIAELDSKRWNFDEQDLTLCVSAKSKVTREIIQEIHALDKTLAKGAFLSVLTTAFLITATITGALTLPFAAVCALLLELYWLQKFS